MDACLCGDAGAWISGKRKWRTLPPMLALGRPLMDAALAFDVGAGAVHHDVAAIFGDL
jgi:hypothetical protein